MSSEGGATLKLRKDIAGSELKSAFISLNLLIEDMAGPAIASVSKYAIARQVKTCIGSVRKESSPLCLIDCLCERAQLG